MMNREPIREGFDVFVHDGEKAVGAVRQVLRGGEEIVIYVEGAEISSFALLRSEMSGPKR